MSIHEVTVCDVCGKRKEKAFFYLQHHEGWKLYKYKEQSTIDTYDYNMKFMVCEKCDNVKARKIESKPEIEFKMVICDKCNCVKEDKSKKKVHKGFRALLNRIKGGDK